MTKHPMKVTQAQIEKTTDGLRVHNTQQDQVYILNPTAALVWEHCDGQTDAAALAKLIQQGFEVPGDIANELLWLTLDQLEEASLLQEQGSVTRHVHSRRQVLKIMAMAGLSAALVPFAQPVKAQGTPLSQRMFMPSISSETTSSTPSTGSTSTGSTSTGSTSTGSTSTGSTSTGSTSTGSTSTGSTSTGSTSTGSTSTGSTSTGSTSTGSTSTGSTSTMPTTTSSTSTEDDDDDGGGGPGPGTA